MGPVPESELPENSSVQVGVSQRSVLTELLLMDGRPRTSLR
jgi:hypothetical protein